MGLKWRRRKSSYEHIHTSIYIQGRGPPSMYFPCDVETISCHTTTFSLHTWHKVKNMLSHIQHLNVRGRTWENFRLFRPFELKLCVQIFAPVGRIRGVNMYICMYLLHPSYYGFGMRKKCNMQIPPGTRKVGWQEDKMRKDGTTWKVTMRLWRV